MAERRHADRAEVRPLGALDEACTRRDLESASLADAVAATGSTEPSRCTVEGFPPAEQCIYAIPGTPTAPKAIESALCTRDLLTDDAHGEAKGLTLHRRVEPATSCPKRPASGGGKAPHPDDVDTPRGAVPRLILASLLFAVALVRADGPIRLTAVLPGVPALLAVGLGDGERAVS